MKRMFLAALFLLAIAGPIAAQAVKLEGQVVCCAECWAEADRTKVEYGTAENLLKAKSCVERDPTLLAVRDGEKFKLYQLALGRFRLPGKNWLDLVGKRVEITGAIQSRKETTIVRVDALNVLAPSLAEREAAKVVGQEVELTLADLSGSQQSLDSLKGRVVILNFWATYCIPCKSEMPDLAAIQNEYAALGVQVIGASTDEVGDRQKILQFVKETKINFPIWIGAGTSDLLRFGLGSALPGTVVVGKDGKIAKLISGVVNQADLKKQIEMLLASTSSFSNAPQDNKQVAAAKRSAEVSSVPS
ncbi:MAG TPA: TlpA disulfide reductase family protein [Pyrinomonadaceae bacterium]|nr:TlpA disulfide reductase family protein [Pyrinomonadaceae bacterium]